MEMEKVTDWAALWRQLVESHHKSQPDSAGGWTEERDPWHQKAREFAARVKRKWTKSGVIREFVASQVDASTTVLDIGAGTGEWAILFARRARKVTAVEPSPSMREVLLENLAVAGVENVEVVPGFWPEVSVEPHDISLCSHSMYASPDLPAFVNRMIEVTRRTCNMVLRVPTRDGVMAEAAQHVWGQPHDSPNFVVGYNVLLQMGILPGVVVDPSYWEPWSSPTLDAALAEIKGRLGLGERSEHDEYLRELLGRRLTWQEDRFVWPKGVRSALAHWSVGS